METNINQGADPKQLEIGFVVISTA